MFILRRLTSQNAEINTILGETYNLIDRERNIEDFKKSLKVMMWEDDPNIYGFISYNDGAKLQALYAKSVYFVMTSDGKTFSNITKK
jgi:hypothetical protein